VKQLLLVDHADDDFVQQNLWLHRNGCFLGTLSGCFILWLLGKDGQASQLLLATMAIVVQFLMGHTSGFIKHLAVLSGLANSGQFICK
jgi:hypothetical protein